MSGKNEVSVSGEELKNVVATAVSNGNIGDILNSAKKASYSLTSDYLSMEVGEVGRFVAMEKSTMQVEDKESKEKGATKSIPCILLVDENGNTVSAGQTVLVNVLEAKVPCLVEITYVENVDMGGGKSYDKFSVFELNV